LSREQKKKMTFGTQRSRNAYNILELNDAENG